MGEKTLGVTALTFRTKGPIDPTLVTKNTIQVHRCRNCNTEAEELRHPDYIREIKEERKRKIKKALKFLAAFALIYALITSAILVRNNLRANDVESQAKAINNQQDVEYAKWLKLESECGLNEKVNLKMPIDGSSARGLWLQSWVMPAQGIDQFWMTDKGKSLDCFSNKLLGFQISNHLQFSSGDIANLNNYDGKYLYNQTFTDQTVDGILGQGKNYQGSIYFMEKDDLIKDDYFVIELAWNSEPIK